MTAMQRAGPTFVKLGQWASTRPDFFPPQLCHELARLHSTVTAEPFAATQVLRRAAPTHTFPPS